MSVGSPRALLINVLARVSEGRLVKSSDRSNLRVDGKDHNHVHRTNLKIQLNGLVEESLRFRGEEGEVGAHLDVTACSMQDRSMGKQ